MFAFKWTMPLVGLLLLVSACRDSKLDRNRFLRFEAHREACADRNPLRNAYFGDLHIHTHLSFDAANADVRNGPEEAYRFARGEAIGLPPYDSNGTPARTVQLAHPLDFAAVTDHSEFLAETSICLDASSVGYTSSSCVAYREAMASGGGYGDFPAALIVSPPVRPSACNADPVECSARARMLWETVASTAEAMEDRTSDCAFATFIGYEWTGSIAASNWHRNVIFGTSTIPRVPSSFIEAWTPELLWDALHEQCLDAGVGCDVLTIPHNSNISSGRMFPIIDDQGAPLTPAYAARRRAMEPLVEIYQHKGSSECTPGASTYGSTDEACRFELVSPKVCIGANDPPMCVPICTGAGSQGFLGACVQPSDFVRGALRRGLEERARIGVNPFEYGFIGSTDTHAATPGATSESTWQGHVGNSDRTPQQRLAAPSGPIIISRYSSPGGLAGVWSEENSRPALFAALRRKETFATSGTRLLVRFFGGSSFDASSCDDPSLLEHAYASGVAMGGTLPSGATAPTFLVQAMQAVDGAPLQSTEIVKGWFDGAASHERVYQVGGDPNNGASVDPATCAQSGTGYASLCNVWTDPDFDPSQLAFYYVRAFENPSCRWHRHECNRLAVDCGSTPTTDPLYACCDPTLSPEIRERAWSSPIWYYPPS